MKNHKSKVWTILASIIYVVTVLVTAGFLFKIVGLNMLPMKYLGLVIFAVVILLLFILGFFFLIPIKKKAAKYLLRTLAMILAIALVVVDVVGIQMVNKFEETMNNLVEEEDKNEVVKVEEFVFGVYVRADDKAETLEDTKRYDFGYSLSYDRNHTKQAVNIIEHEVDRNLNLEEYKDIFEMIDQVLAKEKDAFILSQAYLDIIEEQEGYEDFADKIKCIYECTVTSETQVAEKEEVPFDITKDTFIAYISGNDSRTSSIRNSDVNILAVVNPTTKQVLLVNTPRDYYIPISVSEDGALDKLTHCGTYGIECSMETLNDYYDIDINYYAQLNFNGFINLIDALGGITIYSEKEFVSYSEWILIHQGYNHVDGKTALEFVRERKQFGDGDHARGRHQMAVIKGIIEKMSSGSLLLNYNQVLDSISGNFRTSVSQEEIATLVKMQLNDMAEWNVQSFAVTGTGKNASCYSMPNSTTYVMVPNEASVEHAKTLIDMVYDGEIIEPEDLNY